MLARLPLATGRPSGVTAAIAPLHELGVAGGDRVVAGFVVHPHAGGGLTEVDTDVVVRSVRAGIEAGRPVVGVLHSAGVDSHEGLPSLAGWGRISGALAGASGLVPTVLVVDGPCVGGPALALGLADIVVFTESAWVYVNGPASAARITGVADLGIGELGGASVHAALTGVAQMVAPDVDEAIAVVADALDHLPDNNHEPAPRHATSDAVDRACVSAAASVPVDARRSYDVRHVIADVVDHGDFLELRDRFGTGVVTGFARIGGQPVGIVANQPDQLAGAIDIDGAQKGARFVNFCDAFGLTLVSLVDTPGFRPGKDQEWRGMIRHGAQLAFAYGQATVPRLSVILRKAYGGAFIVMDCKTMGNDGAFAWPSAEIAVMGAAGAVEVLARKRLAGLDAEERELLRKQLEADYEERHLSPRAAAERGYVDAVIDPADTRAVLARAIAALAAKREHLPRRRHDNTPL